jgi:RNA polymerase sigma-70 factor (ECF subfamily)
LDRLADRQLAERSLARLSSEDREILMLRDVEGFSGAEVADLLDLTLPAMKSRLHRARLRLVAAAKAASDV